MCDFCVAEHDLGCQRETKRRFKNAFSDHTSYRLQVTWWHMKGDSVGWIVRY